MLNSKNVTKAHLRPLREEFLQLVNTSTAGQALQKLVDDYEFETVLDIGSGQGLHADILCNQGKQVTTVDFGTSYYFAKSKKNHNINAFYGDFYDFPETELYDAIWCAHTLEHQLNPNIFLKKINRLLKPGGVLAITVPPFKHEVVGGHFTLWNAGTLLYNLVMANFDCSEPAILQYGYNISIIIKKKYIELPSTLTFDRRRFGKIVRFFSKFR